MIIIQMVRRGKSSRLNTSISSLEKLDKLRSAEGWQLLFRGASSPAEVGTPLPFAARDCWTLWFGEKTTIGALIIWVGPKNSREQFCNARSRMNPNGVPSSQQDYGTSPFLSVRAQSRTELLTPPHHCKKTTIKCYSHLLSICLRFFFPAFRYIWHIVRVSIAVIVRMGL